MFSILKTEILGPLFRRVGTAVSSALLAQGVMSGTADTIALGVVAALGLGLDLATSAANREFSKGDR